MNDFEKIVIEHLIEIKETQGRLESQIITLPCQKHDAEIENMKTRINKLNVKILASKIWLLLLLLTASGSLIVFLLTIAVKWIGLV
jgi:hypothetical protein